MRAVSRLPAAFYTKTKRHITRLQRGIGLMERRVPRARAVCCLLLNNNRIRL